MKTKKQPARGATPANEISEVAVVPSGPELVLFAGPDQIGSAQMAAAWFVMLADPEKARCVLTSPRNPVRPDPHVIAAMRECACDLKLVEFRKLTPTLLNSADLVVTMGGTFERRLLGTGAPLHREHWLVEPEPASADSAGRARSVRDLMRSRVAMLVFTEGWDRADMPRSAARVTRARWHSEAPALS